MTASRALPLGDVLSVTTGRLVSRDHIGGVYNVLNFMTGDDLFTHALPRASEEAKPVILAQHPWLAEVEVPEWDQPTQDEVYAWLVEQEQRYGERVVLTPMAPDDHTVIDPLTELHMLRPDLPVIPVVIEEEPTS